MVNRKVARRARAGQTFPPSCNQLASFPCASLFPSRSVCSIYGAFEGHTDVQRVNCLLLIGSLVGGQAIEIMRSHFIVLHFCSSMDMFPGLDELDNGILHYLGLQSHYSYMFPPQCCYTIKVQKSKYPTGVILLA